MRLADLRTGDMWAIRHPGETRSTLVVGLVRHARSDRVDSRDDRCDVHILQSTLGGPRFEVITSLPVDSPLNSSVVMVFGPANHDFYE